MRYHYKKPSIVTSNYGIIYECNHPIYDRCTLFTIRNRGLSVIQQRFNSKTKTTYWTEIDPWLTDLLYLNPGFLGYFNKRGGEPINGLYPTVTIRQIMWALKLKPLPKSKWETVFDRRDI